MSLVIVVCLASQAQAVSNEGTDLQDRVGQLEEEIAVLKAGTETDDAQKKRLWSSLDIQFCGYVKTEASCDDSRTTAGNFVVWVDSEATNNNDDEFNLTANQTRMGFNIVGPTSDTMKTSGKIEWDFYGNYASENKSKIQLRHAFMTLDRPEDHFSILAGQTSDVFSPLVPTTLNYTVLWNAGNIGYRRPQIRATKTMQYDKTATLQFQGAIARTIGQTDPTGSESGEDAGFPTLQGRISLTTPLGGPKPTTIGVSGHWGQEEYDLDATGRNEDFDSWPINLDITHPI